MMEDLPTSTFLVRPQPREGESANGWCWRIYASNGFELPHEVQVASKPQKKDRIERAMRFDHLLGQLVGSEKLNAMRMRERAILDHWQTHSRPEWYEWATTPRFCPLCIAAGGYHQLIWNLPLADACGVHGCHLTSECHACDGLLTWRNLQFNFECHCGAPIGSAPTRQASRFAINFSWNLAAASDAFVSREIKDGTARENLFDRIYRTRDVYEMLEQLLRVRRVLSGERWHSALSSWPLVNRKGARMCPGKWEVAFLNGSHQEIRTKAQRVLKGILRESGDTLIDLNQSSPWGDVTKVLNKIIPGSNPLESLLRDAVEQTLIENSAGIPGQDLVLFNPRFKTVQRQQLLEEFNSWWRSFSPDISTLDLADRLDAHSRSCNWRYDYTGVDESAALELLNMIFHAAHHGISPKVFGTLSRRWHIPSELQHAENPLIDLAVYLSTLAKAEIRFVTAMAWASRPSTPQEFDR